MADGILGLLGAGVDKIQGLLSNPTLQGVALTAATGANPLLGLLAGPIIKNSREQKALENDVLRQALVDAKRRSSAQQQLTGLLGDDTAVSAPIGLMNMEGGMDVLPAGRRVPTAATAGGQRQLLGLLSQLAPETVASTLLAPTEPSGLDRKLTTVEGRLGRPLTDTEVLKLSGGGTTINVGGESKLDEPIPIPQLPNIKMPNGATAPIGMTFRQAQESGARVVSQTDQNRNQQADTALGILRELESLAIGPNGLFGQVDPGLVNRAAAAFQFGIDAITQDDPRASQFLDLSRSTIAPFVKFLGESGALAEGDVTRALGLLPNVFPLPDTAEVAREKLATLRGIIEGGVRKMNSNLSDGSDLAPSTSGAPSPGDRARELASSTAAAVSGFIAGPGREAFQSAKSTLNEITGQAIAAGGRVSADAKRKAITQLDRLKGTVSPENIQQAKALVQEGTEESLLAARALLDQAAAASQQGLDAAGRAASSARVRVADIARMSLDQIQSIDPNEVIRWTDDQRLALDRRVSQLGKDAERATRSLRVRASDIARMGIRELQQLDPGQMSDELREAAADRWDQLNGG